MTRSAPWSSPARQRRRLAAVAVVVIGTVIVAAASFALSRADRPAPSPQSSAPSSGRASIGPALGEPPTSRSYLDAGLGAGVADPLGPTTDHPLWFAGGRWWAALRDPPTGRTRLFQLAPDGASWSDTGRVLDERPAAIVDAVPADGHLYVASV
ncbi:MAG: hypothetical protein ACJ761_11410, partial [Chloroflexota bacterium]